ncbi:Uroporphyrinogen decarboxylase in heme biosynthesis [Rhizophlyctis rosea]|nr:Uroporphyrinogen decarboxylase in heme biosynthesis [Rhizophlyctis rosea]
MATDPIVKNVTDVDQKPAKRPRSSYPLKTDADFPPLKNDLILRVARGEKVERAPVWIMRQAGRYLPEFREVRAKHDFFTVCRTPELACEVTLQPIDRYPTLDASIIFSDILVVPQALGLEVQMLEKQGPHFPEPLVDPSHLTRLRQDVDVNIELGYVFDAITLTREKLGGLVPLFGFVGAPWTLMAYMIEGGGSRTLSKAKTWLYQWPEQSKALLQRVTDVSVDFLVGQAKAGAQLLQVFDSWAGELSPLMFEEFSLPYILQIPTRVRARLQELDPSGNLAKIPMVAFARNAHYALETLSDPSSGYDIVSLDWTLDPQEARRRTGGRVTLQGNADPALLYAPKEVIEREVEVMLRKFGPSERYIANLGHGMHPDHDPEHLGWYLQAIRDVSTRLNQSS